MADKDFTTIVHATFKTDIQAKPGGIDPTLSLADSIKQAQAILTSEDNKKIEPYKKRLETLENDLKAHAQKLMRNKQIIPIGFEVPRKAKTIPLILPEEIFNIRLDWKTTDISFDSLKFEEVHFISPKLINHLFASQIKAAPLNQKTGRPSTKQIIEQAFTDCCKLQKIDFTRYKKDAAFVVQSYIQTTSPDIYNQGKGFSEQTIIKYISEVFDANQLK